MNFLFAKKLFRIKKKKTNKPEPLQLIENLEVFKPIPVKVNSLIEDIESNITNILLAPDKQLSKYQQLDEKLCSFVDYLKENVILQQYVNHVYCK